MIVCVVNNLSLGHFNLRAPLAEWLDQVDPEGAAPCQPLGAYCHSHLVVTAQLVQTGGIEAGYFPSIGVRD